MVRLERRRRRGDCFWTALSIEEKLTTEDAESTEEGIFAALPSRCVARAHALDSTVLR